MKKWLIILCTVVLIIAAALACWPRLDIPEGAAVTLLYPDETFSQAQLALDATDSEAIRALFDGHLLLPDWTVVFTGQRFSYSSAYACWGLLFEWDGGSVLPVLPKQGSRHLLQLVGDDALIWLDATDLDALAAIFEAHGILYPPVLAE